MNSPYHISRLMIVATLLLASCIQSHKNRPVYADMGRLNMIERNGVSYLNNEKFSGVAYRLYPNNDTAFIMPFENGKLEGVLKRWYPDKQLAEERQYHAGEKYGTHRGWYVSGRRKFLYQMKNDHYEGNAKEWFENGQLVRDCNYVHGQEEGMERMYYTNGKLMANYQSIKGRKAKTLLGLNKYP